MEKSVMIDIGVNVLDTHQEAKDVLEEALVMDRRVRRLLALALNKPALDFTAEQHAKWALEKVGEGSQARERAEGYVVRINGATDLEIQSAELEWLENTVTACKRQGNDLLAAVNGLGLVALRMRQHIAAKTVQHAAHVDQLHKDIHGHQEISGLLATRLNEADRQLDALGVPRPEGYQGDIIQRIVLLAQRGGILPILSATA